MTHNRLTTAEDIEALLQCPSVRVVDFAHNKLEDPAIVEVCLHVNGVGRSRLLCLYGAHFSS